MTKQASKGLSIALVTYLCCFDYLACLQIVSTHPDTVRFPGFRPDGDGERRDYHGERDDAYKTYIRL